MAMVIVPRGARRIPYLVMRGWMWVDGNKEKHLTYIGDGWYLYEEFWPDETGTWWVYTTKIREEEIVWEGKRDKDK